MAACVTRPVARLKGHHPMLNIGIYRSSTDKWLFGVCGGIAEHLGVQALWVRLAVLAICIVPAGIGFFPTIPIYIALAFLLPKDTERSIISR
jgi:phage shock protein PspC (stress-responsive transcriptional regulator)